MDKKSLIIIIFFMIIMFCKNEIDTTETNINETVRIENCLKTNGSDITLSSCTFYNDDDKKGEKIDEDYTYCCLLTLYKKQDKQEKYCLTSKKGDRDAFDNRIEMFKLLDRNITKVSIDCSSNYFYISIIFIILLLF